MACLVLFQSRESLLAAVHGDRATWVEHAAGRRIHGVELVDYGTSVEGRGLRAVRVPSRRSSAPKVLVCASAIGYYGDTMNGVDRGEFLFYVRKPD